MSTVNHHIKDFIEYYIVLDQPQYAVLLSGKWGSGKTFFVNQVLDTYHQYNNIVKVSLFGLKTKDELHKQVLLKLFNIDDTHDISVTAKLVGQVLKKFTGVNLSDMPMGWALRQEGNQNALFVFDDLERSNIELIELHGYINELIETHKQKVILLADEDMLNHNENYLRFKEKTIGKTFQIEQDLDSVFTAFLHELKNSKEILQNNQSVIKTVFDMAGYKNLRSLRQGLLEFDRLIEHFEQKFKNHAELMAEIIRIFFVLTFEIKSGQLDIQTLKEITALRFGRRMNETKADEEFTPIEKVFRKYSFLTYELFLSTQSWIDFFTFGTLTSEQLSSDLINCPYFFREERKEWVHLWHFLELEEDEFQKTLEVTFNKLESNEYLTPEIVMHVSGILLNLSANELYHQTKIEIVRDMKTYIDENRKKWDNLYTVDDFNIDDSAFGLGYHNGQTDEFKEIKNYLLEKAKETIYEDLPLQGEKLLNNLKENNIAVFQDMLSESRDSILYRLPVFKVIDPECFIDILKRVENKNFRKLINILVLRYEKIGWEAYSPLLEELDFWKEIYQCNNIQNGPVNLKILWLKQLNKSIQEEIIQKIEKRLQQINKEQDNV